MTEKNLFFTLYNSLSLVQQSDDENRVTFQHYYNGKEQITKIKNHDYTVKSLSDHIHLIEKKKKEFGITQDIPIGGYICLGYNKNTHNITEGPIGNWFVNEDNTISIRLVENEEEIILPENVIEESFTSLRKIFLKDHHNISPYHAVSVPHTLLLKKTHHREIFKSYGSDALRYYNEKHNVIISYSERDKYGYYREQIAAPKNGCYSFSFLVENNTKNIPVCIEFFEDNISLKKHIITALKATEEPRLTEHELLEISYKIQNQYIPRFYEAIQEGYEILNQERHRIERDGDILTHIAENLKEYAVSDSPHYKSH